MQVRGQIDSHGLQADHLPIELAQFRVVVKPGVAAAEPADFLQGVLDPLDRLAFGLIVAHASGSPVFFFQQAAVFRQRGLEVVELASELPPG